MKLERGLAVNQAGLRPAVWSEHRLILENKSPPTSFLQLFSQGSGSHLFFKAIIFSSVTGNAATATDTSMCLAFVAG